MKLLAVLFIVAMYTGMRRDELLGLTWSEIDLDQGTAFVRETASGRGPKPEAGSRVVPLSPTAVAALRAWRKAQAADRLAWGPDWPGDDRIFTREDGTEVPGQWTSTRSEILDVSVFPEIAAASAAAADARAPSEGRPCGPGRRREVTTADSAAWPRRGPYRTPSPRTEDPVPRLPDAPELLFHVFESVRIRFRHARRRTANAVWE